MPHFIAECTENIREQADLPSLFSKVNEALAATGIFPIGGIRSRAHWLDTWQMADGKHDYAFVHMTLKIGAGRSLESRQEVGEMLFGLIKAHFADLMENRYLALSFEIAELHPTLNGGHGRLARAAGASGVCRDTITYADGRVDNSGDLERGTPRTALFLGQLVRGMPLYHACGRSPGGGRGKRHDRCAPLRR